MGESFVIADQDRNPARVRFCGRLITILEIRIAAPKQGQLHPFTEDRRDILEKDIQSLLPGQSAHHAQQRSAWGWIKTKPALEGQFIRRTGLKLCCAETSGDVGIGFGVPDGSINAVEDAAQDL